MYHWFAELPNLPFTIDPCEKLKAQGTNTEFNSRVNTLKDSLSLKREVGYIEKTDGTFDFKNDASTNENSNSLTLGSILPNTKGYMHSHPNDFMVMDAEGYEIPRTGFKIFSPGDVMYFMRMLANAKQNNIPLLDVYCVMVAKKNGELLSTSCALRAMSTR
ncbi:hypothetical protein [Chryseobacterium echinoideorum]|uniref:hypothetical protein n=1 Tax=Chryseobacterium echinoideorum TaxID=1549648 RepID=UPI0011871DD8|nr:hypothetical protein [Chryseobacterium echinoideorum]